MKLDSNQDPMGHAIAHYHKNRTAESLRVFSSMFDEDELPVPHLFRTFDEMNRLEQTALRMAHGRVLDVGSGAGCHALYLQERGLEVTSIDVSGLAVETQRKRGVTDAMHADFFEHDFGQCFDTVLMLMNGIGICGALERLPQLFIRLDDILAPGGCLLADSSDLSYIYEDEEGKVDLSGVKGYYGEVDFRMQYGDIKGPPFHWLYIDEITFTTIAHAAGYEAEVVCRGNHHDFLMQLKRMCEK